MSVSSTLKKGRVTHSYIFLFAKETHADVVPERRALRHHAGRHPVLVHGHIEVSVGLHHAACSQDGLEGKPEKWRAERKKSTWR